MGGNVSLINGHIDKPMTNYERIKNMSVEKMAKYHTQLIYNHLNGLLNELGMESFKPTKEDFKLAIKEWKKLLESEVETE